MPEKKKPPIVEFVIHKYQKIVRLYLDYSSQRDWSKMECCSNRMRDMKEILNFLGWEIKE